MAVTVGTLIVDLQANTASFVSGMDKAGQIALTSGRNIEKALTAAATAVGAAFTAVEGALASLLDKQTENAARLYDMAQSTGVTVEALSGLEYVAKQSGISTEQLDKGLEKMSKSLEAAASKGVNSTNAFKTLGVTITDTNGKLLPTTTILESLAAKFSVMPDGPEKTALAMQIFGKAGADLVPLLNRGQAGIADLLAEAQRLGLVIGDDTAAAAKQFEESMNRVKGAVEGAANKMLTSLLPSLQQVINNVSAGAEETNGKFQGLMQVAGFAAKSFIVAFGALQTFFDSVGNFIQHWGAETVIMVTGVAASVTDVFKGKWKQAVNDIKSANADMVANNQLSADDQTKIWKEYSDGVVSFWNATAEKIAKKPLAADSGPAPASKDQLKFNETIAKQIGLLQEAADKVVILAAAQKGSNAVTIEATAAAEAQGVIDRLNIEAEQKKVKALTDVQKARILQITTEKAFATVADQTSKTLADETFKVNEQTKAVIDMGTAFSQGASAIQAATDKAKIDPLREKVAMLSDEFNKLSSSGKASGAELSKLGADLANANAQLDSAVAATQKLAAAQRATASTEAVTNLDRQATAAEGYAAAVLMGADALRKFNIEQSVLAYTRNPAMDQSTEAVNRYRAALEAAQAADLQKATAEKVATVQNLGNIQDEIDQLNKLRTVMVANGQSTLAIDAMIHDAELKKQKDMDDLLLKTNSVSAGFKVFFDQYVHDGQTAADTVDKALKTTMTDFTNTLADGLAKGKLSFTSFVQSVEAMLIKLMMNQLFKQLFSMLGSIGGGGAGSIGGFFSGIFGKAGGGDVSANTAFFVGEKGKELFIPKTPGTIIPNEALMRPNSAGAPQGQGTNIYQNFNITTPSPDSFRASQDQITSLGLNSAMRTMRRNGG